MKKGLRILLCSLLMLIAIPMVIFSYLYLSADMGAPQITVNPLEYSVTERGDSLVCRDSYLRQDCSGLWELCVKGSGQERGAVQGALTKELMKYQEDVFVNQIREIIPSDRYLGFLRKLILIFNRNLGQYIPLEYREEIAALSEFCTHEYDAIGTPYERQLNYHAAHDIGHTMQQYMLVGCSSFGAWGGQTDSAALIIGRNFDFYVGEDFAKNKLITFVAPDHGYRYVSVAWAGMVGVLSGMNECGLTVTINAAKGAIPTAAATPISILTREILQYASTLEEAYRIAQTRQTFVSESILVGSVKDGRTAVIEKTPEKTVLYAPQGERLLCTNHFQSAEFAMDRYNVENIGDSDSKYRYDRLDELLTRHAPLNYRDAIQILRDRRGLADKEIGVGNEMTLNQSIAHHSVVFIPQQRRMWVSTHPWQSGQMVCYDLNEFFAGTGLPHRDTSLDVAADSVFMQNDYLRLLNYRKGIAQIKTAITQKRELSNAYLVDFKTTNPEHYYTYCILGDYFASGGGKKQAVEEYRAALRCEIPYRSKRAEIEKLIKKLEHD